MIHAFAEPRLSPVPSTSSSENPARTREAVPRLALSKAEAAASIGASVDFLEEHVLGELRVVRRGRRVFVPVAELSRWLDRNAALTLEGR
jgi:hypothetical protein